MLKWFLVFCLFAGFTSVALAQKPDTAAVKSKTDSLDRVQDSITSKRFFPKVKKEKTYHPDSLHSPHKAVMRSLMIPGWGQVYNRQWWKVPVIYTGLGLLASAIIYNQNNYKLYVDVYKAKSQQDVNHPLPAKYSVYSQYSLDDINNAEKSAERYRDLSIFGFLGAWGINMVDAYIQAKFMHSYTMDNNLSMKVTPGLIPQPMYAGNFNSTFTPALKITFTLR